MLTLICIYISTESNCWPEAAFTYHRNKLHYPCFNEECFRCMKMFQLLSAIFNDGSIFQVEKGSIFSILSDLNFPSYDTLQLLIYKCQRSYFIIVMQFYRMIKSKQISFLPKYREWELWSNKYDKYLHKKLANCNIEAIPKFRKYKLFLLSWGICLASWTKRECCCNKRKTFWTDKNAHDSTTRLVAQVRLLYTWRNFVFLW